MPASLLTCRSAEYRVNVKRHAVSAEVKSVFPARGGLPCHEYARQWEQDRLSQMMVMSSTVTRQALKTLQLTDANFVTGLEAREMNGIRVPTL